MFTDATYSYYGYVKARILAAANNPGNNPTLVAGIENAQDWPSKDVKFDAFYLLILGEDPIGRQGYSQYAPMLFHQFQWVWINKGTDNVQGVRKANRGDRFVTAQLMKGYLLNGHVPGYTTKLTWNLVNGVFTGTYTSTPGECITWGPIKFHEKFDKASGLVYGAAQTRVWDMTDEVTTGDQAPPAPPYGPIPTPAPSGNGLILYAVTPVPDGLNGVFTAPVTITANGQLFDEGQKMVINEDYTYLGNQVTFLSDSIPDSGDTLELYQ